MHPQHLFRPVLLPLLALPVLLSGCSRHASAAPEPAPVVVPGGPDHLTPPADHATPPPSPLGPEPTMDAHGVPVVPGR